MNPSTSLAPKCFQCGNLLIQVSKVTSHPEGALFPQTVSTYRCSNEECQERRDKEEAKRIKLRDDKLASDKVREEQREEEKKRRIDARRLTKALSED